MGDQTLTGSEWEALAIELGLPLHGLNKALDRARLRLRMASSETEAARERRWDRLDRMRQRTDLST